MKIRETLQTIQAGARNNKYRVLYPVSDISPELDIVCNASSMPGRQLGTTEVYIKGRKYQLASEIDDTGEWEMTIYVTPDHKVRRFFLELIDLIHSFNTPTYLINPGVDNNLGTLSLDLSTQYNALSSTSKVIDNALREVMNLGKFFQRVQTTGDSFNRGGINGISGFNSLVFGKGYAGRPWYQQDIIVEQLDHDGNVSAKCKLLNAFITQVGPLEYSDEEGNVATCTITLAYSGLEFNS